MFGPITVPYESVMLWNVCTLKKGVVFSDVEESIGYVCNTSKELSKGFICGQVFSYAGFLSEEGSFMDNPPEEINDHFLLVTYWKNFGVHEDSQKIEKVKKAFGELLEFCSETKELGYNLQWQGAK